MDRKGVNNGNTDKTEHDSSFLDKKTPYNEVKTSTGHCSPSCLRTEKPNVKAFTASLGFIFIAHVAYTTYMYGMLTTIEKRFRFGSTKLGFIITAYEMGQIPTLILFPHFARNRHRPRLIAFGSFITAFAAVLFSLPHFIYGPGSESSSMHSSLETKNSTVPLVDLCLGPGFQNSSVDTCQSSNSSSSHAYSDSQANNGAFAIFIIATIIKGIGSVGNFTLGVPYVDDNVKARHLPIYYGIMFCTFAGGIIVGFFVSGLINNLSIDLSVSDMSRTDPRWMSAWWLGFLIFAFFIFLAACIMMLFPETRGNEPTSTTIAVHDQEVETTSASGHDGTVFNIREYLTALKRLLINLSWILLVVAGIFEGYLRGGMMAFMPKYMESEFQASASMTSYAKAFGSGFSIILGILLGGFITARVGKTTSQKAKMLVAVGFVTMITTACLLLFGCGPTNIAGKPTLEGFSLKLPCNVNCTCDDTQYIPTCGDDGVTYFSPCHAGCTETYNVGQKTFNYTNCACAGGSAVPGACPRNCAMFIPYNIMYCFTILFGVIAGPAATVIEMRIVEKKDRERALGFNSAISSLLGDFPRPTIFGAAIDSTCLLWQSTCGQRGNCWVYDMDRYRAAFHGIGIGARALAMLCVMVVSYRVIRYGVPNEDEEDIKARNRAEAKKANKMIEEGKELMTKESSI